MMDVARPDWPHGYSDRRGIGPGRKGQCQKFPAGNFLKWVPNPSMLQLTACLEAVSLPAEKPASGIL
jgi:hypothetical protein